MYKFIIFLSVLYCLGSCRKKVTDTFPYFDKATTLNAILQADSLVKVHVSYTDQLSDDTLQYAENARVSLFVNDTLAEILAYDSLGYFTSNTSVLVNTKIKCEVETYNNGLTSATCFIPNPDSLLKITVTENAWTNRDGRASPAVQFSLINHFNEIKYYELRVKVYEGHSTYMETFNFSEEISLLLLSNQHETDSVISKYLEFELFSFGSNAHCAYLFELRTVSESYYVYANSLKLYEQGRYPTFDMGTIVPHSLYTNVNNGYGIFAGYSTYYTEKIQPQ